MESLKKLSPNHGRAVLDIAILNWYVKGFL